tara:strand:- start:439 stop:1167 length:729 start_codon:yes stop_codon:yes gene_type:complete
MKNKFNFFLVKPQLGENIGTSARALKNFGFSKLSIINPRDGWPNQKAIAASVGAINIIKKCKVFKNTEDAIKKSNLIFSFTARPRDLNKKHICISEFKSILKKNIGLKIGLMFGSESSGLSNLDIAYSNFIVTIPTESKFKSLNLSHSVLLVSYEIAKLLSKSNKKIESRLISASKKEMKNLLKILEEKLEKRLFFKPREKKSSMMTNINNLFYRFQANVKEIRILTSIISSLSKDKIKKHN